MALTLKKTEPYRYDACSGEWKVARIEMIESDGDQEVERWKWTAVGLHTTPEGLNKEGVSSALEDALKDVQNLFNRWLEWAGLTDRASGTN